ncbi:MAG TPA: ABC transporter ATP-binding protein, partial [Bacillales bacterium]|nr:ABC transporter ATP-binding protein [Bacillales bacterium]
MLSCNIQKTLRDFSLDVNFRVEKETVTIVGHSGSGKTTVLKLLAGLLEPERGWVRINGKTYFDDRKKIDLAPERRNVGFVFQHYALFPHLSVFDNIAYGLAGKSGKKRAVEKMLETLGITCLKKRFPRELSGGEQQRVAVARALVMNPDMLLLDEPMSALDVTTRRKVRAELKKTLARLDVPKILVTHDYEDALSVGERIIVMDGGRIIQEGTPTELLRNPKSSFVADFSGINIFSGTVHPSDETRSHFSVEGNHFFVKNTERAGSARAVIYPWDVEVDKMAFKEETNVFRGRIGNILPYGNRSRVEIEGALSLIAEISAETIERIRLREKDVVYVKVAPEQVKVLP